MNADQQAQLIAALRGGVPDDNPAGRAGLRLRAMVLSELHAEAAEATAADDALTARLRAHGVFTGRSAKPGWRWPTVRWALLPGLATALGVSLLMLRPPAPPVDADGAATQATQMRGAEQAQRITVADPTAWAAELQTLFAAHKLPLRRVDLPGQQGIELQALLPPGQALLREALSARGVSVPVHGRLFLRVVAAQK